MYDKHTTHNKYSRKRASYDSIMREQRGHNSFKANKKGMAEISIDLQAKRNLLSLNTSNNNTYRQKNAQTNLSQLREEVQQLRMENQSLREEIKTMKDHENVLHHQMQKFKQQSQHQKCQLENQLTLIEDQNHKYSQKIKELFQALIRQKKKKINFQQSNKMNLPYSPSSKSSHYSYGYPYLHYQKQGQLDYYKSISQSRNYQHNSNRQQTPYIPQQDDRSSLFQSHGYMRGDTFGTMH